MASNSKKVISINPEFFKISGKKKKGGNNKAVAIPKIKKDKVFNYFFLFREFQFFYY